MAHPSRRPDQSRPARRWHPPRGSGSSIPLAPPEGLVARRRRRYLAPAGATLDHLVDQRLEVRWEQRRHLVDEPLKLLGREGLLDLGTAKQQEQRLGLFHLEYASWSALFVDEAVALAADERQTHLGA